MPASAAAGSPKGPATGAQAGPGQVPSLLRESAEYGLAVRFLEVVQFHHYARMRFMLSAADPHAIAAVGLELGGSVTGMKFNAEPTRGGHLVALEMLLQTPGEFATLPVVLCLTPAVARAPWTGATARFSFTPQEAADFQYGVDEGSANPCRDEFYRQLAEMPKARVLEIGSRARSGTTRRELFGDRDYVGIDVLPGEGVTVVGDVHNLSRFVEHDSVDVVFSASVFEHLLMPWKVALEMNRVMKAGAIGLIVTHQTCGMHDYPWDFWRFSDTAWPALFNARTGFEVLHTHVGSLMYIVPFHRSAQFAGYEASAGYYQSTVLVRKTRAADPAIAWNVDVDECVKTEYPA